MNKVSKKWDKLSKLVDNNAKEVIVSDIIYGGTFVNNSPKRFKIINKYPYTMSSNWFEHILTKLHII